MKKDYDFSCTAVPREARRGTLTMFMIMFGFTFFSASMWVGQNLAQGLDFMGFVESIKDNIFETAVEDSIFEAPVENEQEEIENEHE